MSDAEQYGWHGGTYTTADRIMKEIYTEESTRIFPAGVLVQCSRCGKSLRYSGSERWRGAYRRLAAMSRHVHADHRPAGRKRRRE